jgi:hypothetical protein
LYYRASDATKQSKAIEHKPSDALGTSSVAAASTPLPLAGAGLTTCTYDDARSFAQWVLWYLEKLKDVEADQEANRSSFTTS